MDINTSCCVTGHRRFPTGDIPTIKAMLWTSLVMAAEVGYTHFISGFAQGTDLYFAELVVKLRRYFPDVTLEAALPYRARGRSPEVRALLTQCNIITVICEEYSPDCFFRRNQYLVESCGRVIAVYDGRARGGTLFTMEYACYMGREVRLVEVAGQ